MAIGSRRWGALTDRIVFPLSGGAPTTAATIAVLVKPDAGNTQAVYIADGAINSELYRDTDGLHAFHGGGDSASAAATPLDAEWQVLAWTKAAGTVRPRLHRVRFGGAGAAVHAVGDATLPDDSPFTSWVLGYYNGADYGFSGLAAAAGVWRSELSDAVIESLVTEAGWIAASPSAWWSERDGFATDRTSGAARTSISGTTHSTDEPAGFWPSATAAPSRLALLGVG